MLLIVPLIGGHVLLLCSDAYASSSRRSQEVIDWLNKVINESILGAALIRAPQLAATRIQEIPRGEHRGAKIIGMSILRLFATLIPIITFARTSRRSSSSRSADIS